MESDVTPLDETRDENLQFVTQLKTLKWTGSVGVIKHPTRYERQRSQENKSVWEIWNLWNV